jgi:hypothetical protein
MLESPILNQSSMTRLKIVNSALLFALLIVGVRAQPALPERLSDQEFWSLSQTSSEGGGYFRGENITNLTSNELWFQYVIPDLVARTKPGNVYLGVGPEQNYTYMVATRPKFAVIFDIRRGNLDLQLMYKAIFELSKTRAEFLSMLFSKPMPAGLASGSTAAGLFSAFATSQTSETLYRQNVNAIEQHLTKTHAFPLPPDDLAGLEAVYQAFYAGGFYVRANPSYADLMTATDASGVSRSYLATEEGFQFLKELEARNLVVPVVGDFGGPRAIRAIAAYLKTRGATVGTFYLSNVEQYLYQDGRWDAFCRSVATLPLDAASTFIRSTNGGGGYGRGGGFVSSLGAMSAETRGCATAGH